MCFLQQDRIHRTRVNIQGQISALLTECRKSVEFIRDDIERRRSVEKLSIFQQHQQQVSEEH